MPPRGLLLFDSAAPTGLVVALAVLGLAVALLALRGIVDWLFGPEAARADYRLVEAGEGLALADAEEARGERLVGLDEAGMRELLDRAEERNEMRLHVVLEEGGRTEWETWRADADRRAPDGVVIEDSKGMVEIHASGRVKAKPPLDEAVRGDLVEILGEAVAR
jgi:hypothetical protein